MYAKLIDGIIIKIWSYDSLDTFVFGYDVSKYKDEFDVEFNTLDKFNKRDIESVHSDLFPLKNNKCDHELFCELTMINHNVMYSYIIETEGYGKKRVVLGTSKYNHKYFMKYLQEVYDANDTEIQTIVICQHNNRWKWETMEGSIEKVRVVS